MNDEFNALCNFLQRNEFKVVIVEGPRGVGKTTFCDSLLNVTDLIYYKTWGGQQKWLRRGMQDTLNLDLPQGTYFVLDFVKQVQLTRPVLSDRGNLSALAYQRDLPYGLNNELHEYYVQLMQDSRAVMLVLTGPEDVILSRRIARKEEDEFKLHEMSLERARSKVHVDCEVYEEATDKMCAAGLYNHASFDLGEGCVCWAYTANGMHVVTPNKEESDED